MTEPVTTELGAENGQPQLSLATYAARNLATTTKSAPQMQAISSRWLLKILPWVDVAGGVYRVNRRLTYAVGDGRVTFIGTGDDVQVIPAELGEIPLLREFGDAEALTALADRFAQREFAAGDVIAESGQPADTLYLVAHGKVSTFGPGKFGGEAALDVLSDGEYFGEQTLTEPEGIWEFTAKATTGVTVLALPRQAFQELLDQSDALRTHVEGVRDRPDRPQNKRGEAEIALTSGHAGEPSLLGTFVDYELAPREYELSVAQTVLRVHTRVADLFSEPMNQVEQQLKLTVEALRERQESELVNNPDFGLLRNAELSQRLHTRTGPPTPDDFDELLSRRRDPEFLLAHPRTIAAFGRECTRRGIYPQPAVIGDRPVPAWRGVPLLPCNKIPISEARTTSVIVLRTGEDNQGVIGLHKVGIPDEIEPSLSVRFMGIDEKAIISYLVSVYYSAAVLVPDALGVLEDVEIGHFGD